MPPASPTRVRTISIARRGGRTAAPAAARRSSMSGVVDRVAGVAGALRNRVANVVRGVLDGPPGAVGAVLDHVAGPGGGVLQTFAGLVDGAGQIVLRAFGAGAQGQAKSERGRQSQN